MTSYVSNAATLQSLQRQFPGATSIGSLALSRVLGIPRKTISNLGDRFPIKSFRVGRHRLYRLIDVALYIDTGLGIATSSLEGQASDPVLIEDIRSSQTRRRRGRRPNVERAKLGASV